MAWTTFRVTGSGNAPMTSPSTLDIGGRPQSWETPKEDPIRVTGEDDYERQRQRWADRLPPAREKVAFCDYVAALSPDEKSELLAICFAGTIQAVEAKTDYRRAERWTHLGWIARHAEVDVARAWKPDEAFLKGATKDALYGAVLESRAAYDPNLAAGLAASDKKAAMVKEVAEIADAFGWRPKLLATLTEVADPQPKAPVAGIMSREAFELQIAEAFKVMGTSLDEDKRLEAARQCLAFNLTEDGIEYGDPGTSWEVQDATAMAELWDFALDPAASEDEADEATFPEE